MLLDENEVALLKRYFLGEELTEREHESAVLIADCYDSHIGQTGLFADVWVDLPEEEREKEFARMCEEDVEDIRQYLSLYPWIKVWRERCEAEEFARWDEEERLEAERDELISRAIDMDEEPPVFGQWANIARSRMRHESPEAWIEMVQQGTASAYLKKVQEEMWDQYGMSVFLGDDTITYEEALADCGGDREKLMRTSLILELHDKPPENPEPLPPSYSEDEDEIIDDDLY